MEEGEGGYKQSGEKMKIEDVKKDTKGEKLQLKIRDADLSFVNAIRRFCTESVPVLAVDTVEFAKNDSVLYDEIIAHRIGLIPLKANIKSFKLRDECSCDGKGCNKCMVKLKLSAKGKEVSSKDMKSTGVEIPYDIPIVKLAQEQELEFVAEARLGVGKEHAKFIPGLVFHTYEENEQEVTFNVESWGQMKPQEILLSASEVLAKKLKEIGKAVDKA